MKLGIDVRIHDTAIISRPELIEAGSHIIIDHYTYISTALKIKDWIHIAPFVSIIGGASGLLTMGMFSNISAGGRVICLTDDFKTSLLSPHIPAENKTMKGGTVVLEDFTAIGTNGVILPGVTMAIGSVSGAGAVITKDTEPWGIYVGTPAKLVGYRDKDKILENAIKLGYEI